MRAITITGTRAGMTKVQAMSMVIFLNHCFENGFDTVIHGCCRGVDREVHGLARDIGYFIDGHPGDGAQLEWARNRKEQFQTIHPTEPYIERNHRMVDRGEIVVAAPETLLEVLRSGTWATVRYARKSDKKVIIVNREGGFET